MLSQVLFPQSAASAPKRYAFAAGCCALLFALRLLLDGLLAGQVPLVLFTLAVAMSAIRGGFGSGVLSTILGAFFVVYFFPPQGIFWIAPGYLLAAVRDLAVFFVVGVILSWLGSKLRQLRWQALETLAERDAALERVQLLSGLLPICAACKKIRDEEGNWQQIESYISKHSEAEFSHGMCPACGKQYYGELWPETSESVR